MVIATVSFQGSLLPEKLRLEALANELVSPQTMQVTKTKHTKKSYRHARLRKIVSVITIATTAPSQGSSASTGVEAMIVYD